MTPEDLEQIRQIVAESEARLRDQFKEALGAAVVAIGTDFSELRAEMTRRSASIDRHFQTIERRLDNLAPVIVSAEARMATFTRSVDQLISAHDENASTQTAQQQAIDQLAARVTRIERELHPEQ
jgi:hypothetical protein